MSVLYGWVHESNCSLKADALMHTALTQTLGEEGEGLRARRRHASHHRSAQGRILGLFNCALISQSSGWLRRRLTFSVRCFELEASKHMATPDKIKRTLFLAMQFALLAVAGISLYYAHNNFVVQSIGLLAIFACLAIVRRSRTLPATPEVRAMQSAWALKPWHWLVGLGLLITAAAAFAWLYWASTIPGYKGAAPVYAFAAAGMACGCWWAGLFARWFRR